MRKLFFSGLFVLLFLLGITEQTAQANNLYSDTDMSIQEKKQLISDTAREYDIPPEILKAIAAIETVYKQFNEDGTAFISADGGIGIMQITPEKIDIPVDTERLKTDIAYNIEIGAKVLADKWYTSFLPKINQQDKSVLEDWYFAIMAYNGLSKTNDPALNPGNTYQEKVYKRIDNRSMLYVSDSSFQFPDFDIRYEADKDTMFFPPNKDYETVTSTSSQQAYLSGDIVYVDGRDGSVNFRETINDAEPGELWPYTPLTITNAPIESTSSGNDYVFYPVKGVKTEGFVASAYLNKGSDALVFDDPIDNNRAAALAFAAKNDYVQGYPTGDFGSNDPLRREHVAVILDNILSLKAPADYKMAADDVENNHPYYEALRKAEYNKLLGGGGKLRPDEYLTRSQMAEVMSKAFASYYKKPAKEHQFEDQKAIWNPEAVNTMYFNKVTVADPFRPDEEITRSQFVLFIYRTMVNVG